MITEKHKIFILSTLFGLIYLLLPTSNSTIDAWGFATNVKSGESLFLSHHLFYNAIGFIWVGLINLVFSIDTLTLLIALNALFASATIYLLGITLRLLGIDGKRTLVWIAFMGSSWAIMRYSTENETYIIPLFFSLLGCYFFVKSNKDNQVKSIFLSGLFAAAACLFHQVMFFWWLSLLIGTAFRKKINLFAWFALPALLVPISYLIVLVFYYGQPLTLEALLRFILYDYYSGAAGVAAGINSLMFLVMGLVRSFFQVHGYIANLSHFSVLFMIGISCSFGLLILAFSKFGQIQWGVVKIREQVVWVHLLAILLQLFFAFLSSGNSEFMVMIPLLIVIVLAQILSNETKFIGLFTLAMLTWNLSVGLVPLHFFNLDNSNILSHQVIASQKEAKQPLYVLFSRPRIENEVEYQTGKYPQNLITGIQYDDINTVKATINKALINGVLVFTDCYNRPHTLSRESLVVKNDYENLFSEYHYQKVDSIQGLNGTYYLYSVTKK